MFKVDHRKTFKHLYHPSCKLPALVEVPPMNFLMMDGHGKPNGKYFQQAASTLYPLAYTLKFMVRDACNVDYHVMPMEVRWRVNRGKKEFAWTMMLMQPEYITVKRVAEAREKAQAKVDKSLLDQVCFESFAEGLCVQFLHIGPYEGMDTALENMLAVANAHGCIVPARNAHDIYLNDVRRTKNSNLKTVMRLPVIRQEGEN